MNENQEWRDKMIDHGLKKSKKQKKKVCNEACNKVQLAPLFRASKKFIAALKDFGGSDEQILNRLEKDYGDQFSIDELKDFMKQA